MDNWDYVTHAGRISTCCKSQDQSGNYYTFPTPFVGMPNITISYSGNEHASSATVWGISSTGFFFSTFNDEDQGKNFSYTATGVLA